MVALKLPLFAGMIPSVDPHLVSDKNAEYAKNTWLYSGALVGMPKQTFLHQMLNPMATVAFRIPISLDNPSDLFNSIWAEFENQHTDFITAPTAGDTFRRYYWASTSHVPKYNTFARIQAGLPAFNLGVPRPSPLSGSAAGGVSATLVARAYVATLVTAYGEEGAVSDPFLITGKIDDTFSITVPLVPAAERGVTSNVDRIRLYRTIVSAAGTVTYYQVHEFTATGAPQVFADNLSDAVIASRPILESTAWTGPPALEGLAAMPNGITAGFIGNELWFSEPYRPHAWPAAYSLTLEYEIVGFAVIGQTLVVLTKGNPYTASGVNPASISTSKLAAFEPCLSRGSIVPSEQGVFYASPNGLILVNPGIAMNVTKDAISRDKWSELANRAEINAARIGSAYYAFGSGVSKSFQAGFFQSNIIQVENSSGTTSGFMIDVANENSSFCHIESNSTIAKVYNDPYSGETFVCKLSGIYWIDQQKGHGTETYVWKSKVFQTGDKRNFAAFRCFFYEPENDWTLDPQNFNINQVYDPAKQFAIVRIYADGKLILAHELRVSGELHRLPSGFKADFWQVEFEGLVKIKNFQMATSVKELAGV